MNLEDYKYRLTNGELLPGEERAVAEASSGDSVLSEELGDQLAIDAALAIALGDCKADEVLIQAVQAELSDRQPTPVGNRTWMWAAAASIAATFGAGWWFGAAVLREAPGEATLTNHPPSTDVVPSEFQFLSGIGTNEDFAAAYAEIEASKGDVSQPRRDRKKQLLFYRWTQSDASAALAFALETAEESPVQHVFAAWARLAPEAALDAADGLEKRALAHRAIFAELARHDPENFQALVSRADDIASASWADLFQQLPASDATALFDELASDRRAKAMPGFAAVLVKSDYQSAVDWANTLPNKDERSKAIAAVLDEIAWQDTQAAGKVLASLEGDHRDVAVEIAKRIAWQDPQAALDWARDFTDGDVRAKVYQRVLREVSLSGNSEIFDMIDNLVERDGLEMVFSDNKAANMAGVFWWSRELDYQRGLNWALALPEDAAYKKGVISGVTNAWMKSLKSQPGAHQEVADHIYAATDDPAILEELNGGIVHQLGQRPYALDEAWDYASNLPEEHGRDRHMMDVFKRYMASNQDRALELYGDLQSDAQRDLAAPIVAAAWAEGAPLEAANWAEALPEGAGKTDAYAEISKSWSQYDSLAASQWVGTLPEGGVRDAAVEQMVNQVAKWDGNAAFQWAATIGESDRRAAALESAFQALTLQDAEAARSAIESTESLTNEERTQLLEILSEE